MRHELNQEMTAWLLAGAQAEVNRRSGSDTQRYKWEKVCMFCRERLRAFDASAATFEEEVTDETPTAAAFPFPTADDRRRLANLMTALDEIARIVRRI